jgi:hypothetical protein
MYIVFVVEVCFPKWSLVLWCTEASSPKLRAVTEGGGVPLLVGVLWGRGPGTDLVKASQIRSCVYVDLKSMREAWDFIMCSSRRRVRDFPSPTNGSLDQRWGSLKDAPVSASTASLRRQPSKMANGDHSHPLRRLRFRLATKGQHQPPGFYGQAEAPLLQHRWLPVPHPKWFWLWRGCSWRCCNAAIWCRRSWT